MPGQELYQTEVIKKEYCLFYKCGNYDLKKLRIIRVKGGNSAIRKTMKQENWREEFRKQKTEDKSKDSLEIQYIDRLLNSDLNDCFLYCEPVEKGKTEETGEIAACKYVVVPGVSKFIYSRDFAQILRGNPDVIRRCLEKNELKRDDEFNRATALDEKPYRVFSYNTWREKAVPCGQVLKNLRSETSNQVQSDGDKANNIDNTSMQIAKQNMWAGIGKNNKQYLYCWYDNNNEALVEQLHQCTFDKLPESGSYHLCIVDANGLQMGAAANEYDGVLKSIVLTISYVGTDVHYMETTDYNSDYYDITYGKCTRKIWKVEKVNDKRCPKDVRIAGTVLQDLQAGSYIYINGVCEAVSYDEYTSHNTAGQYSYSPESAFAAQQRLNGHYYY